MVLGYELKQFFNCIDQTDRQFVDLGGQSWEVDIKIPSVKLVIEYDGLYYHEGEEARDKRKAKAIIEAGWSIVRVREEGLGLIQDHDVSVEQPYASDVRARKKKMKTMVNTVLRHLRQLLKAEIQGIDDYLKRPDLANYDKARAFLSSPAGFSNAVPNSVGGRQAPLFS